MLHVFLNSVLVGALDVRKDGKVVFTYDVNFLSKAEAYPIFPCLPLQSASFAPGLSRAVFEGLIPENEEVRRLLAKAFGVVQDDFWSFLSAIGRDCAGALSIVPAGEVPPPATGAPDDPVEWLSNEQCIEELANLRRRPLGMNNNIRRRVSLAGYQEKIAVRIHADGRIGVPLDGCPSTHIIKPEQTDYSGIVINEHFCMTLLKHMGIPVADTAIGFAGSLPYLLIKRFDRIKSGANHQNIQRQHQYDFCQAFGLPPFRKYQHDGGPSAVQCIKMLDVSADKMTDITLFLQALVCNVLIGNCDAHGKNYSFLETDSGMRLAPLYDVLCTKAYANLTDHLAMTIAEVQIIDCVRWKHWRSLAQKAKVDFESVKLVVVEVAEQMLFHLDPCLKSFERRGLSMEQPERIAAFARTQIAHVLDEAA
jgi:serine/threonine-protein kinase HipA